MGRGSHLELRPVLDQLHPPTVDSITVHDEDVQKGLIEAINIAQTPTV